MHLAEAMAVPRGAPDHVNNIECFLSKVKKILCGFDMVPYQRL